MESGVPSDHRKRRPETPGGNKHNLHYATTERRVESVCRTSGESPGHIDTNTPGGAMQN